MASFYTKDQLDVLAQVVGNRIKNSVTDIRIANELEKSPEHKLITKSYKQSIDALISGSTTDPEKNYTAAENIISFIDALDNGYVAITPEIPSDTEEFWNLNENPRVLLNSSSNLTPSNLNCNFKFQINGDVYNEDLSLDITDIGPWSDRVSVFRDETTGLLGFSANQSERLEIILTIPENMRQYYNQFDLGTGMIAEDGRIYFIIYATE